MNSDFTLNCVYLQFYRKIQNKFSDSLGPKFYLSLSQTACELVEVIDKLRKLRVATVMATLNGTLQWQVIVAKLVPDDVGI